MTFKFNIKQDRIWLGYTIVAAFNWGVWGVLTKLISNDISPFVTHFMFTTGLLFTLPLVVRNCKISEASIKGISLGIFGGILAALGNVSVYESFKLGGQAAVVIPFTNLYPLVTIIIALFVFKEKLYRINGIGILIVVPAIILLSGQSQIFTDPVHFFQTIGLRVWLLFAFLSLLLFGFFSASQKLISSYLSTCWSYLSFVISSVLVSICFIALGLIDFHFSQKIFLIGSTAGFLDGLGVLAIYLAYKARGKASKVSSVASTLQQVFTIILALIFLKERIYLTALTGIILAIFGSFLLSWEKKLVKSTNGTIMNETDASTHGQFTNR
jgi:drug/metabolite transporter (DMT)-like permease